jgi:hypothetical protein
MLKIAFKAIKLDAYRQFDFIKWQKTTTTCHLATTNRLLATTN